MKRVTVACLAGMLIMAGSSYSFASEEELRQEIAALKQRLAELEMSLAKEKEAEGEAAISAVTEGVQLSGFVDTSYTYSFNHPDTRLNTGRVFDTEANNFNVQAAEVVFEKLPPDDGGVGFRTDLFFGQDARIITPAGSTTDEFDLQQAYISFKPSPKLNFPIGNWEWMRVGKFVTMHGAEVIESKDNWNFTRSLLFGYAIPFTHTGVRVGYAFFDGVHGYIGVNNGWDNVKDNNNTKSIEAAFMLDPTSKLNLSFAGMWGPEATSNDHSERGLFDFVGTYKLTDKLTFKLNYDWAQDEKGGLDAAANAEWDGVAGYLRYDANDWLSFTGRLERFDDRDGVRIVSGTQQDVWEATLTTELRLWKDLITRLEYRHDDSDKKSFTNGAKATDHQDTFGIEMIYPF